MCCPINVLAIDNKLEDRTDTYLSRSYSCFVFVRSSSQSLYLHASCIYAWDSGLPGLRDVDEELSYNENGTEDSRDLSDGIDDLDPRCPKGEVRVSGEPDSGRDT